MSWSWAYHRRLWVKRDARLRKHYSSLELKRLTLKSLVAAVATEPFFARCYYSRILYKLPRRPHLAYFRNHCHRTGSGRSVFRFFKYSRHESKRLLGKGLISGFRKSSF